MHLACVVNRALTRAAQKYTDLEIAGASGDDEDSPYASYVRGDDYASYLPPAVRHHFLKTVDTPAGSSGESLALQMKGFEKNAGIYGLEGWQGIGRRYLQGKEAGRSPGGKREPTLKSFEAYLLRECILLEQADLGSHADDPLAPYVRSTSGEEQLGDFFTPASIFSLW